MKSQFLLLLKMLDGGSIIYWIQYYTQDRDCTNYYSLRPSLIVQFSPIIHYFDLWPQSSVLVTISSPLMKSSFSGQVTESCKKFVEIPGIWNHQHWKNLIDPLVTKQIKLGCQLYSLEFIFFNLWVQSSMG